MLKHALLNQRFNQKLMEQAQRPAGRHLAEQHLGERQLTKQSEEQLGIKQQCKGLQLDKRLALVTDSHNRQKVKQLVIQIQRLLIKQLRQCCHEQPNRRNQ